MPRRKKPSPKLRLVLGLVLCTFLVVAVLPQWLKSNGIWDVPLGASSMAAQPDRSGEVSQPGATQPAGLEVYFLDVGQGDSELVRLNSKDGVWTMLIDTGEYAYADGLTECLRDFGVEKIDALVCSHPHTDHMGCMARMVQRFEIGALYMPRVPDDLTPTNSAYEALLDAVNDKPGLHITALHQAAVIDCPESLGIEVLAPRPEADWEDLNNWSAVLRLTYGETSFLFTGDAEKQSEADILEDGEAYGWELRTDVLKCGHHGSKTSSSAKFLKAIDPAFAVISCGEDNDYGHPHKGTMEKLQKLDVEVYRTDRDGTVRAASDGKTISWETGLPSVAAREWD